MHAFTEWWTHSTNSLLFWQRLRHMRSTDILLQVNTHHLLIKVKHFSALLHAHLHACESEEDHVILSLFQWQCERCYKCWKTGFWRTSQRKWEKRNSPSKNHQWAVSHPVLLKLIKLLRGEFSRLIGLFVFVKQGTYFWIIKLDLFSH